MADKKNDTPEAPPQDENQIIAERRAKLARLREGGQAFPNDFRRKDLAADLHAAHDGKSKEQLESEKPRATADRLFEPDAACGELQSKVAVNPNVSFVVKLS